MQIFLICAHLIIEDILNSIHIYYTYHQFLVFVLYVNQELEIGLLKTQLLTKDQRKGMQTTTGHRTAKLILFFLNIVVPR